jgi:hypothetical protein
MNKKYNPGKSFGDGERTIEIIKHTLPAHSFVKITHEKEMSKQAISDFVLRHDLKEL